MSTCKENCSHYSVCGIWDRKVFVDYEKNILSDFSDLPNVEEYCRNYFPKQVEAEWRFDKPDKYGNKNRIAAIVENIIWDIGVTLPTATIAPTAEQK